MVKYLILSSSLFTIGMFGMFLSRKHLMMMLMALELLLLSANMNFMIFSIYLDDMMGQMYSLLVLTMGATESAMGLAMLIVYYSLSGSIAMDTITILKG